MPAVSPRLRARLLATALVLVALGPLALRGSTTATPSVALSTGDASDVVPSESTSEVDEALELPPTTTTSTTLPRPTTPTTAKRVRAPLVIADKPYGDYPAGTALSGPVDLKGTVRDTSGKPVADACITVRVLTLSSSHATIEARTGPDGHFADGYDLPMEAEWANIVVFDCSGKLPAFARQVINVMTKPGQTYDLPITVEAAGGTARGTLSGPNGAPFPNACVYASGPDFMTFGVPTDAQGKFVIGGLPVGPFSLSARVTADGKCDADGLFTPGTAQAPLFSDWLVKQDGSMSRLPQDTIAAPGAVQFYRFSVFAL